MEAIERDINSQLNHSSRFTSQTTRRRTGSLDQLKVLDLSLSGRRRSISLERQVADNQESAHSKTGLQPPIEYSTIMNSKISKALWFVNHKRVKFDEEYHCYLIKDENEKSYQVCLLPKPKCSCLEKTSCSHILAVQHIHGVRITDKYQIPNLGALTKSKHNNQAQGRKMRNHLKNTQSREPLGRPEDAQGLEPSRYLYELLLLEKEDIDDYIAIGREFDSSMIVELTSNLSHIFLSDIDFESKLRKYFEPTAWVEVKRLIAAKIKDSTCGVCNLKCVEKSKICFVCHKSYHFGSQSIPTYRKTESSEWKCKTCV